MKKTTLCAAAFLFAINLIGATPQEEFTAASDALFSAPNPTVDMHLRLADAAVAVGMSTIAIPVYERVINLGADTATTREKLAKCYERVGLYADARDMYRMILKMNPAEEIRDTAAAKAKEMSRLVTPSWAVSGKITTAFFYDSNVNYAPDSVNLTFWGLPSGETSFESVGASLAGSVDASYQLPDSDWSLFTRANLYSYNVEEGQNYSLYYGSLTLGPRLRMEKSTLELPLQVDYFGRGGINKFFSYGFMPTYSYMQSKTLCHTLRAGIENRYYLNVPDKTLYRQDAIFYSLQYAVRKSFETLPLGVTLSVRPGYEDTDMKGFDGAHLETSAMLDYKVMPTITLYGGLLGYWGWYRGEMPGQTKIRNDEQIEGVIGIQKAWWNSWTTDFSYRYTDNQSSIADFNYNRHVVTLSVSYQF
ncbi:MAG: tetratricopeptide repeat protein [bacterium]